MTEPAADRRDPDSRKKESSYSLDHLTWPEVGRELARDSRLILPVGALEQYGPHLPLGVNTLIAACPADPRTFRRYVRGRVPTPPPGSRGTVGRPTLATRDKGEVIYRRYLRTVPSSLDAGEPQPSPTGPTEEAEG